MFNGGRNTTSKSRGDSNDLQFERDTVDPHISKSQSVEANDKMFDDESAHKLQNNNIGMIVLDDLRATNIDTNGVPIDYRTASHGASSHER